MRYLALWAIVAPLALLVAGAGCGVKPAQPDDEMDSSLTVRGNVEAGPGTDAHADSTTADSAPPDTGTADSTLADTAPGDTASLPGSDAQADTASADSESADAASGADGTAPIDAPSQQYTVGFTVSGLTTGATVVVADNGTDAQTVTANGSYTFATPLPNGAAYAVTVVTPPAGETCTVAGGTGAIAGANVTSVVVTCTPVPMDAGQTYTVGGTVSGLPSGEGVVLADNGGSPLTVMVNGSFTFPTPLASGSAYAVTIVTQPQSDTCVVTNATGTTGTSNVTNVTVTCSAGPGSYTLGGSVSGLASGDTVVLSATGGNQLFVTTNGTFTFPTAVASGTMYTVTVTSQPSIPVAETCTVTANGTGTIGSSDVTNVSIVCAANSYTVGGTVAGLIAAGSVILFDNGGNALTESSNGAFTFPTPLASGDAYAVTVSQDPAYPPAQQTCAVSNGGGTVGTANVTNVAVTCTTTPFTIGGTITGLASGSTVTLTDDGTFDTLMVTGNGQPAQGFTFAKGVPSGGTYDVAVSASPTAPIAQSCVVTSGRGPATVTTADVTNVAITCTTKKFTIGGTVSGLEVGNTATAEDNGNASDEQALTSSTTSFVFSIQVASGEPYDVTVTLPGATAPNPQTCAVTGGSTGGGTGIVADANVTLTVTCTCTNGVTVPSVCQTGDDPETGAQWVVCAATCNTAWLSYAGGAGGVFHGSQICHSFGYPGMNAFGDADSVCNESPLAADPNSSCSTPGTEEFDQMTYIGTDANGPEVGDKTMWQCGSQ